MARIELGVLLVERPYRCLDAVGQHEDRRLAALRLRAGIAEDALVDELLAAADLAQRLAVEVAHHARAVVLRDEADDLDRQPVLVAEVDPVADVAGDDPRAGLGRQVVVDVVRAGLVLDEGQRVLHLADVVVVGGDAGEQRVGADRLGRALGEVADHDAVVIRARRLEQQAAQQPVRWVGQLEHLEHGHDPEHVAEDREAADRADHRRGRALSTPATDELDDRRRSRAGRAG